MQANLTQKEYVILVDKYDKQIGIEEKLTAHQEGRLHRAFSVFSFNDNNQLLLQKRAVTKYHSGGLWTNTCCSHPKPNEELEKAVTRRIKEELGITGIALKKAGVFGYRTSFSNNNLFEAEIDHVFIANHHGPVSPHPDEIEQIQWVDWPDIIDHAKKNHPLYTRWFLPAATIVQNYLLSGSVTQQPDIIFYDLDNQE